ncbi:MAG: GNAT family N-acetyltransferase [Oscillospiraceae bacterium]|nr:GNAT family N-acetyltransferase [Oscillospiraceae bacterium]
MTTIYLIRHGQAEGNLYRRCHSWHNGLLTLKGREQLKALEKRFEDVHFDAVYSSDLYRAMSTAGAIYRPRGLALRVDPALREIGAGVWEDVPWGQLLHDHRDSLAAFLDCRPDWQVEGSETFQGVRQRMDRAIRRIAAAHPGQTVAVASHGCAIKCGLSVWLGLSLENFGQLPLSNNTGVAKLEVENGQVKVLYYNDDSHLDSSSPLPKASTAYGIPGMERNALRFRPLPLPRERETYLAARRDGWQASHGTMDGFDGERFLAVAERNSAQNEACVLLALLGDTPVGVLQMDWEQDAQDQAGRVPFFYMAPEFRSKGLGVQLLGHAVCTYRAMGRQVLRLRCAPENDRAKKFYTSHGFYKVGEESGGIGHLDTMEKYIGLEL